jgi:hypothetical protein
MKFELTDPLKRISDLEIINDLRSVANFLKKQTLKVSDYSKKNGAVYSRDTALRRFGNWEAALKKAELKPEKNKFGEKTKEELVNDINRVANELNNPRITFKDYRNHGKYDGKTIQRKFGGWIEATKQANLEIGRIYTASTEELLQNLLELWTLLGRQPKHSEVIGPNSKYHASTYSARFGSWQAALEKFIEYINSDIDEVEENNSQLVDITGIKNADLKQIPQIIKRTPRGINLRLRWIILKRDNFSCKNCGRSPAKDPTIILHVDHKTPWSKGGETVVDNLEALCQQCNLGKSNLTDI